MDWLAQSIHSLNLDLPQARDRSDSVGCSWFISPSQHAVELIMFTIVVGPTVMKSLYSGVWDLSKVKVSFKKWDWVDWVMAFWATSSLAMILFYKWYQSKLMFLWSPCHVANFVIVLLCIVRNKFTANVFNVYLHLQWAPWMALLQPDMRGHTMTLEPFSFWWQHVGLVVIPVVFMMKGTYPVLTPSRSWGSYAIFIIYHTHVLTYLGIIANYNLNYMCHPPLGPLQKLGLYYRPLWISTCQGITMFTRGVYTEFFIWLAPAKGVVKIDVSGDSKKKD
eukprot:GFYU01001769.1.p1 GENE.GFYU01001769.1~~GFYU01001769.1.p1  ORF type:complete len:278 (+),score=30.82 GFYU01001769.1:115-948(+)